MIVRWGLGSLAGACADAGVSSPLLVASPRWDALESGAGAPRLEPRFVADDPGHVLLGVLAASTTELLTSDRAKGLREWVIVIGHVLPNALIPVVTLGGLAYANLLTGAVMTETIFMA